MTVEKIPTQGDPALGQFFTPAWFAEAAIERWFPDLDSRDVFLEPSCGTGAFLGAIPREIEAIGVEIDPALAWTARRRTGRQVIEGDFRTVPIAARPNRIVGNPPFVLDIIEGFLDRAHGLLPEGGRMGLILPAYAFQTSSRLARWAESWSIEQEAIPRDIFPGLSKPLAFVAFSKDRRRSLVGFAFYKEASEMKQLSAKYRDALARAVGKSAWKRGVAEAIEALGGIATPDEVCKEMAGRRPTENPFWKEQIRKVLRQSFATSGDGRYFLPLAA